MNLEKLKERIDTTDIVEELIFLSGKVLGKSSDEAKKVIEMFITKSYLLGKRSMLKIVDD